VTIGELKEQTRDLEKTLEGLLRSFEERTGCRVVDVSVKEEGPEIYDMEVQVRLDPLPYPQRLPKPAVH
jgi:hypothetical protein